MHTLEACDVTAVVSRSDRSAFIELPYALHREREMWVPPLRSEQRRLLDRRFHPFYEFGDVRLFLARRDGRTVGRIAAVDNPNHNDFHGTRHGFFGLFECADDPDAAAALFRAAGDWLRQRGLDSLFGPVAFSTNYECGMLIEGFDRRPAVQMPYNPSYYPWLMSACGFTTAMDLLALETAEPVHENERLVRIAARARTAEIRIRPLDLRNFDAEAALIRDLYNASLDRNWGFSPITAREFRLVAKQLRPVVRPELGVVAEVAGEPAGFAFAAPDIAPALAAARGRLHTCGLPLGLIRLLRARRELAGARVIALGVREKYRRLGLALLMHMEVSRGAHSLGHHTAELSWVLENNLPVRKYLDLIGARTTKKYRLYQRPL